jgi:prefoldin subunit 5
MDEKLSKETEILKNTKRKCWKWKTSINQIKKHSESITNKLDQAEERMSGVEDKVKKILQYRQQ